MHRRLGQSRPRALRLVTVALAMGHRPVTLAWLRDRLGLYVQANPQTGRTQFERDKAALADAGVPIVVDGDTYRAVGGRSPRFTPAELDALTAVAGLVADPPTGAALAAFAAHADAYPDVRRTDRISAGVPEAPRLLAAVEDRRAVRFAYRPANAPADVREIEPWGLRARRGHWYVVGHDRDRDAHRHFRLDRITTVVTDVGPATSPRPEVLPADLLPAEAGDVVVALAGRGGFDAARLGADVDPATTDAARTVTLPAVRDETALGFALATDATIVAPPELEAERRLRLQMVHDLHSLPMPVAPAGLREHGATEPALDVTRLRRLLALPAWLDQRVEVTLTEAARGFGVDEDELLEDLAVLRDVTLPGLGDVVDTTIGPDGTIEAIVAGHVPLAMDPLARARVQSLVTATATVEGDPTPGLARLARRLDGPRVVALHLDDSTRALAAFRAARDAHRVVAFLHRARGDAPVTQRRLTPTHVDWEAGAAYVGGWDHDRAAGRWFRLDRVARVAVGEVDPDHHDVDLGPVTYVPRGPETEVVVRCTHVGSWLLQRSTPTHRLDVDDGTVWAVVRTDTPGAVVDDVVVAGGEAEVVTPPELRRGVADRAAALH